MNPPSLSRGLALATLSASIALSGCATHYRFNVDAIHHPEWRPSGFAYRFVDSNQTAMPEALVAVARDRLERALSSRGFFPAPSGVEPAIEITVDFETSGPFTVPKTRNVPTHVVMLGEVMTGERLVTYRETTFRKSLRLAAREVPGRSDDRTPRQLWSVLVTNNDESNEPEKYLRLMIAAAAELLGQDTAVARSVLRTDRNGRLLQLESATP